MPITADNFLRRYASTRLFQSGFAGKRDASAQGADKGLAEGSQDRALELGEAAASFVPATHALAAA